MYHKSVLAIDVGGGTQDILLFEPIKNIENCTKLVLPSPTVLVRNQINKATQEGKDIFLTGPVMGGGPSVRGVKDHLAAGLKAYATPEAAKTIYDDLDRVQEFGVIITEEPPATNIVTIATGDLDLPRLEQVLKLFQIPLPEEVAVAVQDHGEAIGQSNRLVRSKNWEEFILSGGNPYELVYREIPTHLTRMQGVKKLFPQAILMDTGPAAIIGALCDPEVARHQETGLTIVNVGNMHTLAFLIKGDKIWGMFEHHTKMMTPEKLAYLLARLQQGKLTQEEIYQDGGHGGTISSHYSNLPSPFEFVSVTGPNRRLAEILNPYFAVPYGDMMLSGCFGLVKALAHSAHSLN
jgi:uncharacterized protein (DUF1786 family)